ncbi:unnamed protein product [Miscanthus lutarioriparius]|uniref:Uncharacterized protein n=1 Tax=Miscanthus lutarioriparius TaxID=422564 RepID=A0A811Q9Z3_9POAL|nr:unnamed protein product [Miscanthus lutarioriparius]
MAASAPIRLLSPSHSPWPPQDLNPRPVPRLHASPARHHHLLTARCALSPPSLDFPLLPFQPVEALYKRKNSFVHFVLDPVVDSSTPASFVVR